MDNIHKGHRTRLKNRYIKEGLEHFEEHNCLELLLFYAVPRKDTNPIAHELIKKFGSINEVFNASIDELCKIEGITENSAILLTMIPKIVGYAGCTKITKQSLDTAEKLCDYCYSLFRGETKEKVRIICFDSKLQVVSAEEVESGTSNHVNINARTVIEIAIKNKSDLVVIAHNHPDGDEMPSGKDVVTTRILKETLENVNINLLDHIIVGQKHALSMKNSGYFCDL